MRILLVQDTDWHRKGPHDQHHLAEKLSLKGHTLRVIDYEYLWQAHGSKGLAARRRTFEGVRRLYDNATVTVVRPGMLRLPRLDHVSIVVTHSREIRRQLAEYGPDVLVYFGILNNYVALREAHRQGIPFVYYWTDVPHLWVPSRLYLPLALFLEKWTLRGADLVIGSNKGLRDRAVLLGAPSDRSRVLRKGVDFGRFRPDLDGGHVRRRYGVSPDDTLLVFVGTLAPFTGLAELSHQLTRTNSNRLRLMIVGAGELQAELEELRRSAGDRLILTGRVPYDEVPAMIAAADACVLPFHESKLTRYIVPMKMYDYMAMKKPVISTNLAGVVEEFGEGNGIVFVEKPEDIVARALELTATGNLPALGEKAWKTFIEGYSWDTITDQFEQLLEEVISSKRRTGGPA